MMSDHFQQCQDTLLGQFFHSAKNPGHPLAHIERVVVRLGEWGEERRGWGGGNTNGGVWRVKVRS